jgi:hypothetical protein
MKIKDIVREEASVEIKPLPGASEIDVDGKAIGTATDPATADMIKKAAETGTLKLGATDQTTSESGDDAHSDQVKKVIKYHGKPVGEIGIDPEASPGNSKWYVKHYASGHDTVGFDNAEEALAELKHIVKHGMKEAQDIGGDATDEFIKDVEVKPHVPGSYEAEDATSNLVSQLVPQTPTTPDTDGPGVGIDSAQGFKDAIRQGVGSSDPEIAAQIDKLVVAEPDGTVDVDQTMYNMIKVMDDLLPQLVQFHKDMITMFTKFSKSPEFAQASPADQASVLQSIKDLEASLPATEKAAADSHAQIQQNEPMMQQNIKDRKLNQQLKGTAATPAPMSEADKALLEKMRMIAGLR